MLSVAERTSPIARYHLAHPISGRKLSLALSFGKRYHTVSIAAFYDEVYLVRSIWRCEWVMAMMLQLAPMLIPTA
jgi:hypothetical protein